MRDLANQNYSGARRNSQKAIKLLILVAAGIALIWFVARERVSLPLTGGSEVVRDAPKGLTPVKLPDSIVGAGEAVTLKTEKATFTNVSDLSLVKASATRKYGDGSYTLAVEATLPDPKGSKYEVWLVGGDQPQEAGFLNGQGTDWTLVFRDKDYYSKYDEIWITREITNNDNKPEKHILEGSF